MALFGRIMLIVGLIITVIGFVLGFGFMFQGDNEYWAKIFLISVPFGFLLMFAGLSTVVMFSPRSSEERSE
jgi:uncharacterized membrane protein